MEDNIDLKIKFVQTDLTDKGYIYRKMVQNGDIFNPSLLYENSDFLLKLSALNAFRGGVLSTTGPDEGDTVSSEDSGGIGETEEAEISESAEGNAGESISHETSVTYSDYVADGREYRPDDFVFCYDDFDDEYYFEEEVGSFTEAGYLSADEGSNSSFVDLEGCESQDCDNADENETEDGDETEEEDGDGDEDESEDESEDFNPNEVKVEFNTTGKMSVLKNQITITYDESYLFGFRNAIVNIMMDSQNPDIITIQKDNFIKSTLTLEKDKRSISDYDDSHLPITVAVKTLKMKNNMTKRGGEIDLLYTVETNGSPTEMVSYSLSAQRRPDSEQTI